MKDLQSVQFHDWEIYLTFINFYLYILTLDLDSGLHNDKGSKLSRIAKITI